jgi:hypothetical protein
VPLDGSRLFRNAAINPSALMTTQEQLCLWISAPQSVTGYAKPYSSAIK